MKPKNIAKYIFLTLLLCNALVVVSCNQQKAKTQPRSHKALVSAVTVHSGYIPVIYSYTGVISSPNETKIIPQVSGILLHNNFAEGSFVKQGDVLFELDSKEYEMRLQESMAKKEAANAVYLQSKKSTERANELLKQKFLSDAMAEEVVTKQKQALNNLKQAQANYEQAKLNLERCKIRAPISGTIGRKLLPDGSFISAGTSVLAVLTQLNNLNINFSFSSKDFIDIKEACALQDSDKKQAPLQVRIYSDVDRNIQALAMLDFTSPFIDQNTDTVNAQAILNNNNHKFIPGQFVRAELEGIKQFGIDIPEESLVQDVNDSYVYALREVKLNPTAPAQLLAIRVPVQVIKQLENRHWLLKADANYDASKNATLYDGDKVLTKGLFMVEGAMAAIKGKLPGAPVVLTNLDGSEI